MLKNRTPVNKISRWQLVRVGLIASVLIILSGCRSSYYVKVVDQNGDPVSGALLKYGTSNGNPYFFRGDSRRATTDAEGMARLIATGTNYFYELKKEGYQFDLRRQFNARYGGSIGGRFLSSHSRKNPLIIYGWKRGPQPDLTIVKGWIKLVNDGEPCTVKLFDHNGRSIYIKIINDLEWHLNDPEALKIAPEHRYVLNDWSSILAMPGAKIKKTNDLFMHEADVDGYTESIKLSKEDKERVYQLFLRSESDSMYGGVLIFYRSASSARKARMEDSTLGELDFQIWFNEDGSRNIMRKADAPWYSTDISSGGRVYRCEKDL